MTATLTRVFSPLQVGTLALHQRVVTPPHGGGNGNLMGTDDDFEAHCALWLAKVRGGIQWVGGGPNFVRNPLPIGFEPTGVGAHGPGFFRDPRYPSRIGEFAARVHDVGGYVSVQMVLQGGMPIAPTATFSGYADHRVPHVLDAGEIAWLIREYAESAAIAIDAGVDAIEIHANHDDVVQWFLSPLTNHRTDAYGGSFDARRRLLREIAEGIRGLAPRPFTFGLRLCLDEMIDGGYTIDTCRDLLAAFTDDGTVDYFSLDVGGNWGAPSYIPMAWHADHEWSALCGEAKQATSLPVVYAGRVTTLAQAETILAAGDADLVAMARATMADPEIVAKTRRGDVDLVRPCIGLNECIHRKQVEGLLYACGVSPRFAHERTPEPAPAAAPRRIVVVGGGPAGTETAALAAERGHHVELWERSDALGGALAVAALARGNARYRDWIDYQTARLRRVGVTLRTGTVADVDALLATGADAIVLATGATARRPDVAGTDLPHVCTAVEALRTPDRVGRRVLVVSEDDGPAPLSVADHLAGLGRQVTLIYRSTAPSPLVGKYSVGSMLARLFDGGVEFLPMTRLTAIDADGVGLASSYGERRWRADGFDTVVLACGAVADDSLHTHLRARLASAGGDRTAPDVHLLGDAYAPRRMVFATRQAWALARTL